VPKNGDGRDATSSKPTTNWPKQRHVEGGLILQQMQMRMIYAKPSDSKQKNIVLLLFLCVSQPYRPAANLLGYPLLHAPRGVCALQIYIKRRKQGKVNGFGSTML
jgi:small neutral amino acid transporter SnatA (MarC family)